MPGFSFPGYPDGNVSENNACCRPGHDDLANVACRQALDGEWPERHWQRLENFHPDYCCSSRFCRSDGNVSEELAII